MRERENLLSGLVNSGGEPWVPLLFAGSDPRQALTNRLAASLRSCLSALTFFSTQTPQPPTARKQVVSWALDTACQAIEGKAKTKP